MKMLVVGPDPHAEITRHGCTNCHRKIRPGQAVLTAFNKHAPHGKRHHTIHIDCLTAMMNDAPTGTTPTNPTAVRTAFLDLVASVNGDTREWEPAR